MKIFKFSDIILNVIVPVTLGYLIYLWSHFENVNHYIKDYLPDGLWAYALLSALLIIWNRQVNILWCCIAALFSVTFECLQYIHFIAGTGDIWDIAIYVFFGTLAIKLNIHYKKKFYATHESA